jgi:hypothetical protein
MAAYIQSIVGAPNLALVHFHSKTWPQLDSMHIVIIGYFCSENLIGVGGDFIKIPEVYEEVILPVIIIVIYII